MKQGEKEKHRLMGGLGVECSGGKIRKTHLQKPVRGFFKVSESITEFQVSQPDFRELTPNTGPLRERHLFPFKWLRQRRRIM